MFRVGRSGATLRLRLGRHEAELLRRLTDEMRSILTGSPTDDAISRRLFPGAYEDEKDAAAYRDLVGDELQRGKLAALDTVSAVLGGSGRVDADLDDGAVHQWLVALTDMRLALGTRLDVDDEAMGHPPSADDPEGPQLAILHWLGWLQESIVENAASLPAEGTKDDDA